MPAEHAQAGFWGVPRPVCALAGWSFGDACASHRTIVAIERPHQEWRIRKRSGGSFCGLSRSMSRLGRRRYGARTRPPGAGGTKPIYSLGVHARRPPHPRACSASGDTGPAQAQHAVPPRPGQPPHLAPVLYSTCAARTCRTAAAPDNTPRVRQRRASEPICDPRAGSGRHGDVCCDGERSMRCRFWDTTARNTYVVCAARLPLAVACRASTIRRRSGESFCQSGRACASRGLSQYLETWIRYLHQTTWG